MFRLWKRRARTLVIGQEMADARRAEQKRLASPPDLPSPMPISGYNFDDGYLSLLNPKPLALDSEVAQLCRSTAALEPAAQVRVRQSISMDEFYSLLTFSRRMALFAMRERSVERLRDGLSAIALIELARVDHRDVPAALALLCHAALRIGQDARDLLGDASAIAEPDIARLMSDFANRSFDEQQLCEISGLKEIDSKHGLGFVQYGFRPYSPTIDLSSVMIEIAGLLQADQYRPGGIQIATDLPPIWLRGVGETAVEDALRGVLGGASVSGFLRPEFHPTYESQWILVFVVELPNADQAQVLHDMSRRISPPNHSVLGCAQGPLFCLVIGHSILKGVASYETPASLARFEPGIAEVLRRSVVMKHDHSASRR
jgi:hypothetical protein